MAHGVGRKVAKTIGVPSDLSKWKPADFVKGIGTGLTAGLGGAMLAPALGGLGGIGAGLGKVGGLLGKAGGFLAKNPKMLGALGGLFGGGGGGGMPAAATQGYGGFENSEFYKNLMEQQQNQLKMQQDYMDPNSAYNQLQKGEMMDTIAMNNQLQNRNLAKGGIDPSGGIGLQMNQDAFNKGANQFASMIGNRTPQGFQMGQQNYQNQLGLFESDMNRLNANQDLQSSQAMMNAFNRQQNATNWGDVAAQVMPGLLDIFKPRNEGETP